MKFASYIFKKIIYCWVILFLSFVAVYAQNIDKISTRCRSPYQSQYASILATGNGDITYTPCPTRSSIFTGNVDFTGATVIGIGNVSGTGTANYIPRWIAANTIGNTPFSWNGTTYLWNNTALNSTYTTTFTPSSTVGIFTVGTSQNYFSHALSNSTFSVNDAVTANNIYLRFNNQTKRFTIAEVGSSQTLDFDFGSEIFNVNTNQNITLTGGASVVSIASAGIEITSNNQALNLNSGTNVTGIGDTTGTGNSVNFKVEDGNQFFTFTNGAFVVNNSCVGFVVLDAAGVGDISAVPCFVIVQGSTTPYVFATPKQSTTGIIYYDGAGSVRSNAGLTDAGKEIQYWIVGKP